MSIAFHEKFSVCVTKNGVRVIVSESFHRDVRRRYPNDAPPYIPEISDCGCESYPARLAFSQLRHSISAGIKSEAYYESKVVELLFLLGGECECRQKLPESDQQAVSTVKQIILSHLRACPKIAELAVLTGTSASKLQSDFKTAFGRTIHEYLWDARMTRALELLDCSDAPVYSIALEVGCSKAGRFSERFKKTYGISPAEYRRIHAR